MGNFIWATVLATLVMGLIYVIPRVKIRIENVRIPKNCIIVPPRLYAMFIKHEHGILEVEDSKGARTKLEVIPDSMVPENHCVVFINGKIAYHGPLQEKMFKVKEGS